MRASNEIRHRLATEGFKVVDLGAGKAPCLYREGAPDDAPFVYLTACEYGREFYQARWSEAEAFQVTCFVPTTLEEVATVTVDTLDAAIARARTMLDQHVPGPELAAGPRR